MTERVHFTSPCLTLCDPVALPAPRSMRFSRHEHWNKLLCPSPGDLSDPGIEPTSPASPTLQADSLPSEPPGKPLYNVMSQVYAIY